MNSIRRLRAERRMTVRELAQASGVNKNTISDLEHGLRKGRPVTLGKLAGALGVPVEALEDAPIPPPPRTPLTERAEAEFDRAFAATDAETADALMGGIGAEFDALRRYIKALKAAGIGDDDLRLKRARRSLTEAKRRAYAATSRATDLALNREFGRDRPVYDTVAEYVGNAEDAVQEIEAGAVEARVGVV